MRIHDRKPTMHAKFPVSALALALGLTLAGSGLGAEPLAGKAARRAAPEPQEENILARVVFQSLLGEFALQRGDTRVGVEAWSDLAWRTRDPKVVARAVEVAGFARNVTNQVRVTGAIDFNNLTGFINEPRTYGVQFKALF